jgi:FlaA1/EpsC-like NDP-sugar epimerase
MTTLIAGGTGTLGSTLMQRLTQRGHKVICLSRDEQKQQALKKQFPDVKFIIGDIRDRRCLDRITDRVEAVFHVAALKHVDALEDNEGEALETNYYGTQNLAYWAIERLVPQFVFSSTDKAVNPLNMYGMSKALAENLLFRLNKEQRGTNFSVYRWGNVLGSRGSAIHTFVKTLMEDGSIGITDPAMTRFWILIEDAVTFMLDTYRTNKNAPKIPEMKAALTTEVAACVAEALDIQKYETKIIGKRPGEKIHECIFTSHEFCIRSDTAERFQHDELLAMVKRALNVK